MEGKGVLFKRFADIDVFDIEVDSTDPAEVIRFCQLIAPTFGGINLEDIRAPECFEIEKTLIETLDIPVFHDDQHGTAIISGAALLNALEITGKKIEDVRVVFSGAGASGIACAKLYKDLGVRAENILHVRQQGRDPRRAQRRAEPLQGGVRPRDQGAHARRRAARAPTCSSASRRRAPSRGEMVRAMADKPDHLRDGEPGPGDHARRGDGRCAATRSSRPAAPTTRTR